MAKRKLKRVLKKQRQWRAGSRQKRKLRVDHLSEMRALLKSDLKKVEIRLIRSQIGSLPSQKNTLAALGLNKINSYCVRDMSSSLLGMINRVLHLVNIKEVKL